MDTAPPELALTKLKQVDRVQCTSRDQFHTEIRSLGHPVVLERLTSHWPSVQSAAKSSESLVDLLLQYDTGRTVEALFGPPEIQGRFFYSTDMKSLNFTRRKVPFGAAVKGILGQATDTTGATVYLESLPVSEHIPGYAQDHSLPLLDSTVDPRIWIGNQLTVQTHFDLQENIACCVSGRRRFTLFPPDQTVNLYPGPFEFTLSGPPVSMVDLDAPDLTRFPRFPNALSQALVAELEPGDAIYIPYAWWHQVESLSPFNVLVNYCGTRLETHMDRLSTPYSMRSWLCATFPMTRKKPGSPFLTPMSSRRRATR